MPDAACGPGYVLYRAVINMRVTAGSRSHAATHNQPRNCKLNIVNIDIILLF